MKQTHLRTQCNSVVGIERASVPQICCCRVISVVTEGLIWLVSVPGFSPLLQICCTSHKGLGKASVGCKYTPTKEGWQRAWNWYRLERGLFYSFQQCSKRIGYVNRLCWGLYMDVSQQEYHNPLLGAYSGGTILLTYTLPRPDIQVKGCLLGTWESVARCCEGDCFTGPVHCQPKVRFNWKSLLWSIWPEHAETCVADFLLVVPWCSMWIILDWNLAKYKLFISGNLSTAPWRIILSIIPSSILRNFIASLIKPVGMAHHKGLSWQRLKVPQTLPNLFLCFKFSSQTKHDCNLSLKVTWLSQLVAGLRCHHSLSQWTTCCCSWIRLFRRWHFGTVKFWTARTSSTDRRTYTAQP